MNKSFNELSASVKSLVCQAWQEVQGDNAMDYIHACATGEKAEITACYALVEAVLFHHVDIVGDEWWHEMARDYVAETLEALDRLLVTRLNQLH